MVSEHRSKEMEEAHTSLKLAGVLRLYCLWLAALSLIAATACALNYWVFHRSYLYWFPLFSLTGTGGDFSIFIPRFAWFHTGRFFTEPGFPFTYPAPAAFVVEAFIKAGHSPTGVFIGFCATAYLVGAFAFGKALLRRGLTWGAMLSLILPTAFLTSPEWFLLDRGNIEGVCWILVALGLWGYWQKRWYLAAVLLGLAAALKLYPFILLGLLFSAKRYKALATAIVVLVGTTLLSTYLLGPSYGEASRGIASGLEFFRQVYALGFSAGEAGFDHSLFTWVKVALHGRSYVSALNIYLTCAACGGLLLYWFRIRYLPRVNQIVVLLVCMVLLPPISAEYTLVHLYIGWAVLVLLAIGWQRVGRPAPAGLAQAMIAMACLLATESYLIVVTHNKPLRLEGLLKAIVLASLMVICLRFPWPEAVDAN